MIPKKSHIFDYSGMARRSDLETPEWKDLFLDLEREQTFFTSQEKRFRSEAYQWPRKPLYDWSRVWEYPYVYHQLKQWRANSDHRATLRVLDLGSGVTFFPFALAKLDIAVTCTDIDPICEKDLNQAIALIPHKPGKVEFRLADSYRLPIDDNQMDVVYCISVLEHIPQFEKTLYEVARVLRAGGLFVVTVDIDLRGDSELGLLAHQKMVNILEKVFDYMRPSAITHPLDILHSASGPFGFKPPDRLSLAWFNFKQHTAKVLLGGKANFLYPYSIGIHALTLVKKI